MAYGAYKDLPRRKVSDKVLCSKVFAIASNQQYDGYQQGLTSVVDKFLDKSQEPVQLTHEQQLF